MTVPKKEMNAGVELLLKRMETHPEEFVTETMTPALSKWNRVIEYYMPYLSVEDRDALKEGLNALHQQKFTEMILEALVDPKSSKDGVSLYSMLHPNATHLGGATQGGYTLTSNTAGQPTWVAGGGGGGQAQMQAEHMKAHLEYMYKQKAAAAQAAAEEEAHKVSMLERLLGAMK